MKLGVMIEGQEGLNWDRWRRIMSRVEDLGYESLWRSDHFHSLMGPEQSREREALETWMSLVLTARETTRLRFGPLVCSMTFRHPSLLARMAAAVDELSGGRLVLGVGAGWNESEHRAFGIPFPPVKQRMDMLEEGVQVVRRLFTDEPASFSGRHYSLDGAVMRPKPVQRPHPPLLVGGSGEKRTLRIVAKYADEWNAVAPTPESYRTKTAVLEERCRAVGRDPATIARSVMSAFIVGGSEAERRQHTEALQQVLPALGRLDAAAVQETMRDRGWLVGSPDDVIGQLRALAAEGVQRVMLQHHDQTNFGVLELIARDVMPGVADA
jgi:F420-dependent oxidoreductase-like protein